ncbi:uncharacterized protein LOC100118047 [Nasonia vitripennis]|uniref:Thyroglobulin type-1 domain-containing protein n=1 Tax=Nasonia vitripennis TaxID=7425 RepID=A0A7M7G3Z2_NASVI|nr:uncharacterized protein LOC100118047 [Nasonia vitripennis]
MNLLIFAFIQLSLWSILTISSDEVDNYKCTKKFCEDFKETASCRAMSMTCRKNPNSTHLPFPDTCSCCDYCLKNLEEKDRCTVGCPGAVSPLEVCGPGLQCKTSKYETTCEEIESACTNAQKAYDKRKEEGTLGMAEIRPKCNTDGLYQTVHCIPGSICYCLSPDGHRIFGEIPYLDYEDEKKMTCGCSINAWKALNTLDPKHEISVARCTEIGTFDQLQCVKGENSTCFCVDSQLGSPISNTDIVFEEYINVNMPVCFDSSRHRPGTYSTSCEIEREVYLSYKEDEENAKTGLLRINEPFCQPDGKYDRIQIAGSKKVCTDMDGRQIDSYEADIADKTIDCNCARTRLVLSNAGVVELPTCCPNGNFEAWQCRRKQCFCVDNYGNQVGREYSSSELSKLDCYKKNEGFPC